MNLTNPCSIKMHNYSRKSIESIHYTCCSHKITILVVPSYESLTCKPCRNLSCRTLDLFFLNSQFLIRWSQQLEGWQKPPLLPRYAGKFSCQPCRWRRRGPIGSHTISFSFSFIPLFYSRNLFYFIAAFFCARGISFFSSSLPTTSPTKFFSPFSVFQLDLLDPSWPTLSFWLLIPMLGHFFLRWWISTG